jgi:hypothetical protein
LRLKLGLGKTGLKLTNCKILTENKLKTLIGIEILILSLSINVFSQNAISISGKISDSDSHETLAGASIHLAGTNYGTTSDKNGNYSLAIKPGKSILEISFVGYNSIYDTVFITGSIHKDYRLLFKTTETGEVIVSSRNLSSNVQSTSPTTIKITSKDIKKLPSLMGEADVLRVLQLSPGVQSANEGNSGFYVRGGGADQNLVLLDNTLVYNPSHVLGFFSVFNNDIVRDGVLMKSGLTADYGGRMSSVVLINTIDPENVKYTVNATIGLISSKLAISGPIIKNKLDFYIAGRRSYLDQTIKPIFKTFVNGESSFYNNTEYYFYDLNAKLIFRFSNREKLSFTYYSGKDNFSLKQFSLNYNNRMIWGNRLLSGTYKRIFNEYWFLESNLGYTNFNFDFTANQYNVDIRLNSKAEDINWKLKMNRIKENNRIIFGFDYTYHHFIPNNINAVANGLVLDFGANRTLYAHETALFYNQEYNLSSKLSVSYGLRYTNYLFVGPYTEYNKNEIGEITDTVFYRSGQIIKTYNNLEPRITLKYQFNPTTSVKASYTRHFQYIHLASASTVTLPTDVWLPSNDHLKPQKSNQYTVGYYQNLITNQFTASVEIYYKDLFNQMELLYGYINNFQDKTFDESMVFGTGKSYGIELFLRRNLGKITGWVGYTLSKTERKFDAINSGNIYPAKYDRRHDLNVVLSYEINKKWNVGCTFIYATGNAMTIPVDKYIIDGNVITGYSEINSFRMPAYNRLDLSVNYLLKKSAKYESSLNISVFNVYNRANPYFIYFEISGNVNDYNLKITPKQVSLFPILPSLSWTVRFN